MAKTSGSGRFKYLFFWVYTVIILYPIWFVWQSSFKDNSDLFSSPWALPRVFRWQNYSDVFFKYGLKTNLINSLTYAVLACIISVMICAMASFALTRMHWKLSKLTMGFFLLGVMVPIQSALVPLYISVTQMGLTNPRFNIVSIFVAFSISTTIFILSSFMEVCPVNWRKRQLWMAAIFQWLFGKLFCHCPNRLSPR